MRCDPALANVLYMCVIEMSTGGVRCVVGVDVLCSGGLEDVGCALFFFLLRSEMPVASKSVAPFQVCTQL
jgi:hypothetical protein